MDISQLFKWKKEYIIKDQNGNPLLDNGKKIKVYLRVIGDNDLDRAKKYSLRESKKLRQEYMENLEEVLPDLDTFDKEELATMLVVNESKKLYKQAERETKIPYPKDPSELSLKEQEDYVDKLDTYFERLLEKIEKNTEKLFEKRLKYYKSLGIKDLKNRVAATYIDKIIDGERVKIYNDAILYYAVYNDENCIEKSFNSIEDVRNSTKSLKNQLMNEYSLLMLSDTELKK